MGQPLKWRQISYSAKDEHHWETCWGPVHLHWETCWNQLIFTGRRAGEPAHLHWETCWGPAHLHWETCWGTSSSSLGDVLGTSPPSDKQSKQQLNSSSNWNWDVNHCYRRHLRRRPLRLPHPHHLHSPDTTATPTTITMQYTLHASHSQLQHGILVSDGWWEAWQHSPTVTRNL